MRAADRIKHTSLALALALAITSFCQPVFGADAQPPSADVQPDVQARAASFQTWREQCSDPDPDLRLAYLEGAIASKDASVQRICIRLALQSDNADIRNLGLRAAIATIPQITFIPTMPRSLEVDLRRAAEDENLMKRVRDSYISRLYDATQNGLKMCSDNAEVGKSTFLWNTLAANIDLRKERYYKATILGSRINWSGNVIISGGNSLTCTVNVALTREGRLAGKLSCEGSPPMDIIADLL